MVAVIIITNALALMPNAQPMTLQTQASTKLVYWHWLNVIIITDV